MSVRRKVHQVIVGASQGDAITSMAIGIRNALRTKFDSEIFAHWRLDEVMQSECLLLEDAPLSSQTDLLIYHLSIGNSRVHDWLRSRQERIVVSYHNVTPALFYERHNPEFALDLRLGRQQVKELASRAVMAIADSTFNAGDLTSAGYNSVHVVPAGVEPSRLAEFPYDLSILSAMNRRYPNGYVITVGQVLPHKRIEQVIQSMHLMNSTMWRNIGLVICGAQRQHGYFHSLLRYQKVCAMVDVHFAGAVSDQQLATYMRGASAFLGLSDHEGFCIPPLEAAALGVPVVIKGAGAVPETVGDGGLVLPFDSGASYVAEAVHEVLTNDNLRSSLILNGFQLVKEVEKRDHVSETIRLIEQVVG